MKNLLLALTLIFSFFIGCSEDNIMNNTNTGNNIIYDIDTQLVSNQYGVVNLSTNIYQNFHAKKIKLEFNLSTNMINTIGQPWENRDRYSIIVYYRDTNNFGNFILNKGSQTNPIPIDSNYVFEINDLKDTINNFQLQIHLQEVDSNTTLPAYIKFNDFKVTKIQ